MSITLSNTARSRALYSTTADGGILGLVDGGTGAGQLRVYSGTRAVGPDTAIGAQVLLAEFTLSDPSFSVTNGVATLDVTPALTDTGIAAGTATWFRIVAGGTAAGAAGVLDGKVGTSGADLNLNTTTISVGVNVEVTGGTITMPAGTAD